MPRRTTARQVTVRVASVLSQGTPLTDTDARVTIPADKVDDGEVVFRVAGGVRDVGLVDRDLLIVEPRANGRAATGEFVIAALHDRAFIGRWWAKHGARSLVDDTFHVIAQSPALRVLGAVTLIVRRENP